AGWKTVISTVTAAFKTGWTTVENDAKTIWNAIKTFFTSWWSSTTAAFKTDVAAIASALSSAWNGIESTAKSIFGGILSYFKTFWSGLESGFSTVVSKIKTIWQGFQSDISAPVNWVVTNVYDKYIVPFWNDVAGAVGLKTLPKLAEGGFISGGTPGRDSVPAMLMPGEAVVPTRLVPAIAPFLAANGVPGFAAGGLIPGYALGGLIPGYALGGLVPDIFSSIGAFIGSSVRDVENVGKTLEKDVDDGILAPFKAITKLLIKEVDSVPGGKGNNMVTAMQQMPVKAWEKFVSWIGSHLPGNGPGGGGASGPGSAKGNAVTDFAEKYLGTPYVWGGTSPQGWDCSGFTEFVYDHFGWTPPRTSEAQYGWVKRIADPVPGALAFFTGSPIDAPPGHVGIVTSPDTMIDAYGTGYGTIYNTIQGSSGTVMGFGIPPAGFKYDEGGWLQPGVTMVVNSTGRPEPVLSGEQLDLLTSGGGVGDKLDRIAGLLMAGPRATAGGMSEVLNGTAHTASFRQRYPRNN
ncbi:MAG TPA: NlpC/P60 family protein, partial [Urbifossiella sp.]|nr:NlpC/P60 family protein [Urbifossiella sp.]